jgi:4-hydroxy-tetrahydrodipicolinate reductase
MKIAIIGYGKMGKTIERMAMAKGHSIVYKSSALFSEGILKDADVAIEFSIPEKAVENIKMCINEAIPVVSGTTGWLTKYPDVLKFCKERNGSFIYASNFSIGVNLFFQLNGIVAKLMKPWEVYTASVEEIHHTEKKDAPSGTAITLAEEIIKNSSKKGWSLEETKENELTIKSKRIPDVKGTHIVKYSSDIDAISIKHQAYSREGFAAGAILAAEWIQNKKGVYSMSDVLKINF